MKKYYCEFCKQKLKFKNHQTFGSHKSNCKYNPNKEYKLQKIKEANTLIKKRCIKICPKCNCEFEIIRNISKDGNEIIHKHEKEYCSRKCSNNHIQTLEQNENRSKKLKGNILWNKGNKNNQENKILCKNCNKEISLNKYNYCKECYIKLNIHSKIMKGRSGGFRETGGRGKQGKYQNILYQSSWELAWIIYNLDHNIKFERNTKAFEYIYEGKKHKYYPDFILKDGTYIEIKGYNNNIFKEKQKQFPEKLIVITKEEIKLYIEYVQEQYGNEILKK